MLIVCVCALQSVVGSNPTQGISSFSLEAKSCPGCSLFVCCAFAFLYLLVLTCMVVLPLNTEGKVIHWMLLVTT